MEHLPVEVVGNILSRLGGARDVVIASATCRRWRQAFHKHLQTLSFNSSDWPGYHDMPPKRLEIVITQTIFQITELQGLSILMDTVKDFTAATVIAWLLFTRETLRRLVFNVRTNPTINILEICGRQKLEKLALANTFITGVEPSFQRFPCLRSLSLTHVSISALDLSLLLTACPKLEDFELVNPEIAMSDAQVTLELTSPTVKTAYVEGINLDKFIMEADSIEHLNMRDCALVVIELVGKNTLRYLKFDDVSVLHIDIGEPADNLEIVDISNFTIIWPKFFQMISKSSKLKKLKLWEVAFDDINEYLDMETLSESFPQLSHLSLSYDLKDGVVQEGLHGNTSMNNVIVLELGWTMISDIFVLLVENLVDRCPNLEKLLIYGSVSDCKTYEECMILANFTPFMVRLMRKYVHIEVQFKYE